MFFFFFQLFGYYSLLFDQSAENMEAGKAKVKAGFEHLEADLVGTFLGGKPSLMSGVKGTGALVVCFKFGSWIIYVSSLLSSCCGGLPKGPMDEPRPPPARL